MSKTTFFKDRIVVENFIRPPEILLLSLFLKRNYEKIAHSWFAPKKQRLGIQNIQLVKNML